MPESGTKPYIDQIDLEEGEVEEDYVKKMRRPTWFNQMNVQEEKHSELVKPYQWAGYHQQEHYYPNPLFNPEWPHDQPTTEIIVDRLGSDLWGCFLTSPNGNFVVKKQCDRYIRIGFIQVSASSDRFNPGRWRFSTTDISGKKLTELFQYFRVDTSGGDFDIRFYPTIPYRDFPDAVFNRVNNTWSVDIRIEFLDPLGSTCSETVRMYCEQDCYTGAYDCLPGRTYFFTTQTTVCPPDTTDRHNNLVGIYCTLAEAATARDAHTGTGTFRDSDTNVAPADTFFQLEEDIWVGYHTKWFTGDCGNMPPDDTEYHYYFLVPSVNLPLCA
jgi:hypothetical protein